MHKLNNRDMTIRSRKTRASDAADSGVRLPSPPFSWRAVCFCLLLLGEIPVICLSGCAASVQKAEGVTDDNFRCLVLLPATSTPVSRSVSVPLQLRADSWGTLRDRRGYPLDEQALVQGVRRLSTQQELLVELTVETGFEEKVTARQLALAVARISTAASSVGPDAAMKLRIILVLPKVQRAVQTVSGS